MQSSSSDSSRAQAAPRSPRASSRPHAGSSTAGRPGGSSKHAGGYYRDDQGPYPPYNLALEIAQYLQASFLPGFLPSADEYRAKEKARQDLEYLTDQVSPGAKLLPFGSMANGFALKNSDMDLCCFAGKDAPERNPSELVEILGKLIEQETKYEVKMLPRARIPIIKLNLPPTGANPFGIACDIGFENRLALENTRLLLTYAMVDPRLRMMVLFLKIWTKRRKINNPYHGTLSSYGYVLLVIYYLVHVKKPPVLPNLQQMPPLRDVPLDEAEYEGHDITFFDDLEALARIWQTQNHENVGDLLIDFFRFFSKSFPYSSSVISIRSELGLLTREAKNWPSEDREFDPDNPVRDSHKLCIEDPFQLDYNVARTVTRDGLYTIRGEFIRATRLMRTVKSPERIPAMVQELCEEREDTLLPHYSYSAAPSPRRRSAPSPRLGPAGVNAPPMPDARLWLGASQNGYTNPVPYDSRPQARNSRSHDALQAHLNGHSGQEGTKGRRNGLSPSSPQLGPSNGLQHALDPRGFQHPYAAPAEYLAKPTAFQPALERRSSWDGAGPSSSSPSPRYDLHRLFQGQTRQVFDPATSAATAPASPELSSSASSFSGGNGPRAVVGPRLSGGSRSQDGSRSTDRRQGRQRPVSAIATTEAESHAMSHLITFGTLPSSVILDQASPSSFRTSNTATPPQVESSPRSGPHGRSVSSLGRQLELQLNLRESERAQERIEEESGARPSIMFGAVPVLLGNAPSPPPEASRGVSSPSGRLAGTAALSPSPLLEPISQLPALRHPTVPLVTTQPPTPVKVQTVLKPASPPASTANTPVSPSTFAARLQSSTRLPDPPSTMDAEASMDSTSASTSPTPLSWAAAVRSSPAMLPTDR